MAVDGGTDRSRTVVRRSTSGASPSTTSACAGPTLDEVFLALTGRPTEDTATDDGEPQPDEPPPPGPDGPPPARHPPTPAPDRPPNRALPGGSRVHHRSRHPGPHRRRRRRHGRRDRRRTIRKFVRTPQLLVVGHVQGAMFLFIFRYVFGGAINTGTLRYVDFLVPGFLVTGVLFAGHGGGGRRRRGPRPGLLRPAALAADLPLRRSSWAGPSADTVLLAATLVVTIAVGFAVGFRIHGHVGAGAVRLRACVVFGFAFDWVFIYIGLVAGNAQAAQGMSLLVFPFTFVSSAYVPVDTMPGWMQPIADHQPITYMVDSVRALTVGAQPGQSTAGSIAGALIWSVVLIAVFAPIAVARYRKG